MAPSGLIEPCPYSQLQLKYEKSGDQEYPHLYGTLPVRILACPLARAHGALQTKGDTIVRTYRLPLKKVRAPRRRGRWAMSYDQAGGAACRTARANTICLSSCTEPGRCGEPGRLCEASLPTGEQRRPSATSTAQLLAQFERACLCSAACLCGVVGDARHKSRRERCESALVNSARWSISGCNRLAHQTHTSRAKGIHQIPSLCPLWDLMRQQFSVFGKQVHLWVARREIPCQGGRASMRGSGALGALLWALFPALAALVAAELRQYDFVLGTKTLAPDGVPRSVRTVNGQFPGPAVTAAVGDVILVHVHNNLSDATAIHWHGMHQRGTPFMDGVPGVTQCAIPPGTTLSYRFTADQAGTYWYHSHSDTHLYVDGLAGPLIVRSLWDPHAALYDAELTVRRARPLARSLADASR
jgi:hypothetical protein